MKKIIGIFLMIIGIILPFYLLISGIIQLANGISPFIASEVVLGICKIVFCEMGAIPLYLGYYLCLRSYLIIR